MAKSPNGSPLYVSRRLPGGDRRRGLQVHVKLVGEVVWAWSQLHLAFGFAFSGLFGRDSMQGQAIWVALKSDSAQRDVLENALHYSSVPSRHRKSLHWAISETGRLAGYRNDIVHGAMGWELTQKGLIPTLAHFGNPLSRIMRYMAREAEDGEILDGPDLRKLMTYLRGDLTQLSEYVLEVWRAMPQERPRPLPRRPRLQAHAFVLAAQGKKPPRKPRKAPRSRRRPSDQ